MGNYSPLPATQKLSEPEFDISVYENYEETYRQIILDEIEKEKAEHE